jgi:biopolymer transport protein TolR
LIARGEWRITHPGESFRTALIDIYKTRAQKVLFIKSDDNSPGEDVAAAIDDAHYAGVDHVGLITAQIEAAG